MTAFEIGSFEIGSGATICYHSDRKAGTVIARTAKTITWQQDTATLISGQSDVSLGGFVGSFDNTQQYKYEPNPKGLIRKFSLRKSGRWVQVGDSETGASLIPGRSEFFDRNF